MTRALNLRSLALAPPAVRPPYDPRSLRPGVVHLGAGAFFRAHVAVYADRVAAAGEPGWGVVAVGQRSPRVVTDLARQDGLYCVVSRSGERVTGHIVGAVRSGLLAAADPAGVVAAMADPGISMVTMTVTEKGYPTNASRRLDPGLVADELEGGPPRTAVGQLAAGILARARVDAGPLTVLSCDNLQRNGSLVEALVRDHLELRRETVALDWMGSHASFPNSMVDRIVPAPTEADVDDAAVLTGLVDHLAVGTEPSMQWVVDGNFPGAQVWRRAGLSVVEDIDPYERLKLRVLNATHSFLAALGVLSGRCTIADAMADPAIERAARKFALEDQLPTLSLPRDIDARHYAETVLERFRNPGIRHLATQVATDGSLKLRERVLPAIADAGARGVVPALRKSLPGGLATDGRGQG